MASVGDPLHCVLEVVQRQNLLLVYSQDDSSARNAGTTQSKARRRHHYAHAWEVVVDGLLVGDLVAAMVVSASEEGERDTWREKV